MAGNQPLAIQQQAHAEQKGWRRNQDLIDALPYVDTLSPEEKQRVESLIEDEMLRSEKKPSDYLAELPAEPASTIGDRQLLQGELQRIAAGGKLDAMDVDRYNLNPPTGAKKNDPVAWQKALDNAHAQLEHQYNRLVNLELLLKFGPEVWRAHNEELAGYAKRVQTQLTEVKRATDDLNRERKLQQIAAGREIQSLEADYMAVVLKNADIDLACRQLESEVAALKSQQKN